MEVQTQRLAPGRRGHDATTADQQGLAGQAGEAVHLVGQQVLDAGGARQEQGQSIHGGSRCSGGRGRAAGPGRGV